MSTQLLTDTQIMRKVIAKVKQYIKERNYIHMQCRFIKGTYHFTNVTIYGLTAAEVLENATGLYFVPLTDYAAKIDNSKN